ncbi:MAG: hypothetical protein KC561_07495, partial [Myxococcales bacterium]|nr:hypothetical protein [Myxococcales bacterium]
MTRWGLSFVTLAVCATTGCGDEAVEPEPLTCADGFFVCVDRCVEDLDGAEPTLTYLQDTIFEPTCATEDCHGDTLPAEELDLSTARSSFRGMVDVDSLQQTGATIVVPGEPENSYLMNKLNGVG